MSRKGYIPLPLNAPLQTLFYNWTVRNKTATPCILTSAAEQFAERATVLQLVDNEISSAIQNENDLEAETTAIKETIQ